MRIELEIEYEEIIVRIPRELFCDKLHEKFSFEQGHIGDVVNKILGDLKDATSERKKQESNKQQYQNRDCCWKTTETGCGYSNECCRKESEKEVEKKNIIEIMTQMIKEIKHIIEDGVFEDDESK